MTPKPFEILSVNSPGAGGKIALDEAKQNSPAPLPPILPPCPTDSVPFSVLVCTCNRGSSIVETVRTIFAIDLPCTELIIIDQSDTTATECALSPFLNDPRLRYIHTALKGKGAALNRGLQTASSSIVAITDDDVEVPCDWPQQHLQAFADNPRIVLTYGNVLPVEFDAAKGFIPTYYTKRDRLVTNVWQKMLARGIGANTAVRRSAILDMGGFDPAFGPGGAFKSSIDIDMTIRCIFCGHHVYESCDSNVYHSGFRSWEQGSTLIRNAYYGIGASHIKVIKCGRGAAIMLLLWEATAYALLPALWATLCLRRPLGWNRVLFLLRGVRDGLKCPVDRERLIFKT